MFSVMLFIFLSAVNFNTLCDAYTIYKQMRDLSFLPAIDTPQKNILCLITRKRDYE